MIQDLISSGHSWKEIKHYTLSEVGVFVKAIRVKKAKDKAENIIENWMSTNADKKGIEKIVDSILNTVKEKKQKEQEVLNDWKRLASLKLK